MQESIAINQEMNNCQFNKKKESVFFFKNLFWILLFCALIILGYRVNAAFLVVAVIVTVFVMLTSSVEQAFCWSLFLVPSIRVFDGLGVTFIVDVLFCLPIINYFVKFKLKKNEFNFAFFVFFIFYFIEILHGILSPENNNFIKIGGWCLCFFVCILYTLDKDVKISKTNLFSAFSTGVFVSALTYLLSNQKTLMSFFDTIMQGARLEAFSGDPNYYALYICLALSGFVNTKEKPTYCLIVVLLLTVLGLLTASKMCIILMVVIFGSYLLILLYSKNKNKKSIFFVVLLLIACVLIFYDYVSVFIDNFLRRLGVTDKGFSMNAATTGRSNIVAEYFNILFSNVECFFFGKGFRYHVLLNQSAGFLAHNTYLDIILSWGLIGSIVFISVMAIWISKFKKIHKVENILFSQFLPAIVLLLGFLSLSAFSALMFPLVLAFVILQLRADKE